MADHTDLVRDAAKAILADDIAKGRAADEWEWADQTWLLDNARASLHAVAPTIARRAKAEALRELADVMDGPSWNHKDDWGVSVIYTNALRTRADEIERS